MAQQALFTPNRALDANAYAQPGATATFYASGTMTLITVYSDEAGTIATTNPITADGNGVFPQVFFNGEAKVIVRDADGATLWTVDPCPATSGDVTGAASVSFNPTVAVPQTNVQAAIEAVAESVITGASGFGLGITGNAPTISNIDATAQASGVYRFTGTSTGTFPSGVTASTTGLVRIDRQTAAEAIMYLRAAGGTRYFVRHLAASTWGAWQGQIDDSTLVTSSETIASNDNDTTVPTSAAVIDYVPAALNATGSAPIYACRAWGNVNGTGTPAFRASGNCSTVTRVATGIFEVTLTTALADANYSVVCSGNSVGNESAADLNDWFTCRVVSSSVFRVRCYDTSGVAVDPIAFFFAVFR